MKTVSLNTILDLLAYYGEVFEENVEVGNRLIETIDDLLPFYTKGEHDKWLDITASGTYEQFIDATYDVLWNAAMRDVDRIRDYLLFDLKWGCTDSCDKERWQISCKTRFGDLYPDNTISVFMDVEINAPFLGCEFRENSILEGELRDTKDDVNVMLNAKLKQIARRLGKEVRNND